jgi:hypothetical protein
MMFRTLPEHFCTTFRAMFLAARNTIPVRNMRITFRTDTLSVAAHLVSSFKLDHSGSLIGVYCKPV